MADIALENIGLHYHGQPQITLSGINLTIPDNGITVILGASGCGKTSLLNIVAGFLAPSGGRITRGGILFCILIQTEPWYFRMTR